MINDGTTVYIGVGQRKYYLQSEQDYCPDCMIKIDPGEEVRGYFNYSSFGMTAEDERQTKSLRFRPIGFDCA